MENKKKFNIWNIVYIVSKIPFRLYFLFVILESFKVLNFITLGGEIKEVNILKKMGATATVLLYGLWPILLASFILLIVASKKKSKKAQVVKDIELLYACL